MKFLTLLLIISLIGLAIGFTALFVSAAFQPYIIASLLVVFSGLVAFELKLGKGDK